MQTIKLTFLALLGTLWACVPSKEEANQEQDVKALINTLIKADNAGDLNTVVSLYDADAVLMRPGKSSIQGREAIYENYKVIFEGSKLNIRLTMDELLVSDQWAVTSGQTLGKVISKNDGTHVTLNDKYVMVLRKTARLGWKITRLIWNSNLH